MPELCSLYLALSMDLVFIIVIVFDLVVLVTNGKLGWMLSVHYVRYDYWTLAGVLRKHDSSTDGRYRPSPFYLNFKSISPCCPLMQTTGI